MRNPVQKFGTLFMTMTLLAATSCAHAADLGGDLKEVGTERFTSSSYKRGDVVHVVLFRYENDVSPAQKEEVKKRFLALQSRALRNGKPYIVSIVTGVSNSGEGVDQDYEQGFVVRFKSEGDRNYYVGEPIVSDARFIDPAHQAFKDFVGPLLKKPVSPLGVLVFDFSAEERR
ncbi:MAG: Dabb family protein [Bdellovibrionota bacterium]